MIGVGVGLMSFQSGGLLGSAFAYAAYAFAMDFTKGIYKTALAESTGIDALKAQRGPDIAINGGFDSATNWTTDSATVTIGGGVAQFSATPSTLGAYQTSGVSKAGIYAVTYTVTGYSAGAVSVWGPGYSADVQRNANGTYTEIVTLTGAGGLAFKARGVTTLAIDNVSIQETAGYSYTRTGATKLENEFLGFGVNLVGDGGFDTGAGWSTATGWTIAGGKATKAPSAANALLSRPSLTLTANKKYRLSFDITAVRVAGELSYYTSNGYAPALASVTVGSHSIEIQQAGSDVTFFLRAALAADFDLDNVSVQEVFPQVSVTEYGPERVPSPTFANGTGWLLYSGATISNNRLTLPGSGEAVLSTATEIGKPYEVEVTVLSAPGGLEDVALQALNAVPAWVAVASFNDVTAGMTYRARILSATSGSLRLIRGASATPIEVSSFSVKEVLSPTLTYLGTELVTPPYSGSATGSWTVNSNSVARNGSAVGSATVSSVPNAIVGRTYELTATVADLSGDTLFLRYGNINAGQITANGVFTARITATGAAGLSVNVWSGSLAGQATITNISVREVIPEAFDSFATDVPGIVPNVGYWSRPAVTNLLLRSQEFDNASWSKINATTGANTALAPDGTLTGDTLTATGAPAYASQSTTTVAGAVTVSVFAKAGTSNFVQLCDDHDGATTNYCNFDLANGTVGTSLGVTGKIVPVAGGWHRCSITYTALAGSGFTYVLPAVSNSAARAGTISSGTIHLWQAQLVAGSDPGPIIPTQGTTLTVGADTMNLTSPITVDEDFIVWAVFAPITANTDARLITISDGSSANRILLTRLSGNNLQASVTAASASAYSASANLLTVGRGIVMLRRKAGVWTTGTKSDGGVVALAAAAAGAFPTGLNKMEVGHTSGAAFANNPIEFVGVRKGTFSDAEITTMLGTL